jgi:hypothetical protein
VEILTLKSTPLLPIQPSLKQLILSLELLLSQLILIQVEPQRPLGVLQLKDQPQPAPVTQPTLAQASRQPLNTPPSPSMPLAHIPPVQ